MGGGGEYDGSPDIGNGCGRPVATLGGGGEYDGSPWIGVGVRPASLSITCNDLWIAMIDLLAIVFVSRAT